jgi:hypothetical protein
MIIDDNIKTEIENALLYLGEVGYKVADILWEAQIIENYVWIPCSVNMC